ncbi:MAG TPA: hypothetical protein VFN21_00800 [Acidimicrobiales bacterium]|nr:hypothetical protein [Acidimicrobiales bacterium]
MSSIVPRDRARPRPGATLGSGSIFDVVDVAVAHARCQGKLHVEVQSDHPARELHDQSQQRAGTKNNVIPDAPTTTRASPL